MTSDILSNISTERRLDEERLQMEAKKREREEQHLFLTAKVISSEAYLGPPTNR